jgi:hypothetical protein
MRMSSGASTAYEKPRSGRSSCIDETPGRAGSRRLHAVVGELLEHGRELAVQQARLRGGLAAEALEERRDGRVAVDRDQLAVAAQAPRQQRGVPAAPNVASTIVSPGRGSRSDTTSSARTGTWSVSVGKTLGNIFRAPFDLVQVSAPFGAIPNLEVVEHPGHRDLALDARLLQQRDRQDDAALLVRLGGDGAGEEVALHLPALAAERVERSDPPASACQSASA